MIARALALLILCSGALAAADEGQLLRLATVAPDGSAWAREFRSFGHRVESGTGGRVHVKWYWNGIAGDEQEELERIRRGQLDGAAFGLFCDRLSPTVRVTRVPGLFQSLDEATATMNLLRPDVDREAHEAGFVVLSAAALGPETFFLRAPAHNLEELRRIKVWRWDVDEVGILMSRAMGLTIAPAPVAEASQLYAQSKSDGFVGIPQAALAYQWAGQARYFIDLRYNYLWGCLALSERAFKHVSAQDQAVVLEAGAWLQERFFDLEQRTDGALLGGVFQGAGLKSLPVSPAFKAEFFQAARVARDRVGQQYVPVALLARVLQLLADYRLEHAEAVK
jgi:TRAP-type C4-dicarboxylate transport system substrate-binding protein